MEPFKSGENGFKGMRDTGVEWKRDLGIQFCWPLRVWLQLSNQQLWHQSTEEGTQAAKQKQAKNPGGAAKNGLNWSHWHASAVMPSSPPTPFPFCIKMEQGKSCKVFFQSNKPFLAHLNLSPPTPPLAKAGGRSGQRKSFGSYKSAVLRGGRRGKKK